MNKVYGTINRHGDVRIEFNSQMATLLIAPGIKLHPCERCGVLESVPTNVVSFLCADCEVLCEDTEANEEQHEEIHRSLLKKEYNWNYFYSDPLTMQEQQMLRWYKHCRPHPM